MRWIASGLILLAAALAFAPLTAAESVAGAWTVTTRSAEGEPMSGVLALKEEQGKLSGAVTIPQGEFKLIDPKLEGQTLKFKLLVDDNEVSVEVTFEGDSLQGAWRSGPEGAPVKGARKR